jgi:hypothetical protein
MHRDDISGMALVITECQVWHGRCVVKIVTGTCGTIPMKPTSSGVIDALIVPGAPAGKPTGRRLRDMFHWAAVCFVAALTAAVLRYAAGTPMLSEAAALSGCGFAVLGAVLILAGVFGRVSNS